MSLVAFKARNHPQQVAERGAVDDVDDRRTPDAFWRAQHERFGFTLDAAATAENTKLPRFCVDGLSESWARERVWCNPPYSDVAAWVAKATWEMSYRDGAELVVMLLPANRTEQRWWQEHIEPRRDRADRHIGVHFLPGRMRFDRPGWVKPKKGDRPPFGLCLVIWRGAA